MKNRTKGGRCSATRPVKIGEFAWVWHARASKSAILLYRPAPRDTALAYAHAICFE